jgi:hypothetical protein
MPAGDGGPNKVLLIFFIPLCFFMLLVIFKMALPDQSRVLTRYLNDCLDDENEHDENMSPPIDRSESGLSVDDNQPP